MGCSPGVCLRTHGLIDMALACVLLGVGLPSEFCGNEQVGAFLLLGR